MADVLLFNTADGGEIECVAGQVTMDEDGVWTAVYISLFGGNEDDSGKQSDDAKQWWGNRLEVDPAKQIRSETAHLLQSLPVASSNLRLIEDAVVHDLSWMADAKLASFVGAEARMPARNRVDIDVTIVIEDQRFAKTFSRKWEAQQ